MKNIDVLSKAIEDEKATPPAPAVDLSKLSTDDVEKIATRVVEMLSERTPDAPSAEPDTPTATPDAPPANPDAQPATPAETPDPEN